MSYDCVVVVLLVAVVLLGIGVAAAPPNVGGPTSGCPYAAGLCPSECGQKVDANGCRRCLCGVPYFRWPQRQCPSSRRHCPPDCGHILDDNGCRKCFCGHNPFFRFPWAPRPVKKPVLSKHVHTMTTAMTTTTTTTPQPEPEFKLDVRTFDAPTRPVSNRTANSLQPGEGFVF